MSLRTCIVDLRGMGGWTKLQRQRKASLGLVAPTNTQNPLVFVPETGPHTAAGWGEYDGHVPPDTIYSDTSLLSEAHPFPDDKPLVLWRSGLNVLYGLNLASPGCGETFAEMLVTRTGGWARLCCFDYFNAPGDPLAARPGGLPSWASTAWFADFAAGTRMMVNRVRQLRSDWRVFGYDWNYHPASSALDGIFLEDRYTRLQPYTATADLVTRIALETRRRTEAVLEMRDLSTFTAQKRAEIEQVCEQMGWYLSRGKDATAIGG